MQELPEKLKEFQKLVKHLSVSFKYGPALFKLAKIIRDDVIKSNPSASVQDITIKSINFFDNNKFKYLVEYVKLNLDILDGSMMIEQ